LVRSSRIGASYRTFIKQDLDALPFPTLNQLTPEQTARILQLALALERSSNKPWDEIDDFIFALYGFNDYDATVI
jgi:hypothetical protein